MSEKEEPWDLVITPKRSLWNLGVSDIWEHRDLLVLLVKRDIVAFYKQTILGPLWFFIQPMFTMAVYVFIFGRLANLSTDGLPQPLFYLSGITFWTYFSQTLVKTSTILRDNARIFGKVYFPRIIMPLSLAISNLYRLGIQFFLLMLITIYFVFQGFEWTVSVYIWILPVLILLLALQAFAFGLIVSALTTKYRDMALLLTFGIQLLMYTTPVVYPLSSLSGRMASVVSANPVSLLFEGVRKALYSQGLFDWTSLLHMTLLTFGFLLLGIVVFNRVEKSFVDTI